MTMNDEEVVGMLRRLDEGPHRPARVDLARAVRDGRRRRRARRMTGAGSAALVVALAALVAVPVLRDAGRSEGTPPAAAPPTGCTVERLPLPAGAGSGDVTTGDPTGRYLLGSVASPDLSGGWTVLWVDGRLRELPPAARNLTLLDVNTAGQAIGVGGDRGSVGYFHQLDSGQGASGDGGVVRPLPGGPNTQPVAINEAGRIAGNRLRVGPDDPNLSVPVVWASSTSTPVELALPGPDWAGRAEGIADDGTIVGSVGQGGGFQRGYLWRPDGTGEFLPTPPGAAHFFRPTARGPWAIGSSLPENQSPARQQVARLRLSTGEFAPLPQVAEGFRPLAGNARGWVVGLVGTDRAGLLTEAGLLELAPPRIDPAPALLSPMARVLSDDGRTIAGFYQYRSTDGQPIRTGEPLRWTCR
ncbi:hypothetical protein [Micromonospora cathayae]|uniref:Uncharacterized protein n=1 Tax=Micromonospora cathayae TaxID=3028804 RepID=A0ABY7ZS91_9ACTN|nr:hypothetical protein [Micromonospora sp. HUAS 3]WDZ85062.1 hypothetical protein PVK37_00880 [Micromonospora sp. HUAS 3]